MVLPKLRILKLFYINIRDLLVFPILLFSIAIKIFAGKRVDVVYLYAQRIGHHIYNHEMYRYLLLGEQSLSAKSIIIYTGKPANSFVHELLKKNNPSFSYFLIRSRVLQLFRKLISVVGKVLSVRSVSWDSIHPRDHIASVELPYYSLCSSDLNKLSNIQARLDLAPKKYVSFHNRDSLYLDSSSSSLNDGNFHDYRDYNFNDTCLLVNFLDELGYSAVRHGSIQKPTNCDLFPSSLIDLSCISGRNSSEDIILISESLFYVGCTTGFSMVPWLFRKPMLLINYIPFRLDELCIYTRNTNIVPKLLKDSSSGRLLSFQEIASLNYNIHCQSCPFAAQGLEVIDNSPEEILSAGRDMFNLITNAYKSSSIEVDLQRAFWASVSHLKGSSNSREMGISIPNSFLAKYSYLL